MQLIKKEILKACHDFRIDTLYWDRIRLEPHENSLRNYPAPWIKKTVEILKIMDAKIIIEIGSTRSELTQQCISYHDDSYNLKPACAPGCCQDGHSTYFWAREGFEVYTVDIDERCKTQLENQYKYHIKEPMPQNLHLCIPQDGIEFLKNFDKPIDFLFLDGWDVGTGGYDERHLEAFLAAKDKLAPMHLISIDDTDFKIIGEGKDKLLSPYLLDNGYVKILWGRQTIYIKNEC